MPSILNAVTNNMLEKFHIRPHRFKNIRISKVRMYSSDMQAEFSTKHS